MKTKIVASLGGRFLLGVLTAIVLWSLLFHLRSGAAYAGTFDTATSKADMKPNARVELPPLRADSLTTVENWMADCGYPWHKEELTIGERKLVCIDLTPYYGQPGHHVFIYQVLDKGVSMLFCSIVYKPPHPEKHLAFTFVGDTDSLDISSGETQCLSVTLKTLWCD